ncbi:hypothetical protein A2U01_0034536, partial [Trifolium medium]|nr:hypothetical protein [Trifolium medium]
MLKMETVPYKATQLNCSAFVAELWGVLEGVDMLGTCVLQEWNWLSIPKLLY